LLVWQRTLGSVANLSADGNNSRIIEAGDLAVWQSNFGSGSAMVAAAGLATAASDADVAANLSGLAMAGVPYTLTLGETRAAEQPFGPRQRPDLIQRLATHDRALVEQFPRDGLRSDGADPLSPAAEHDDRRDEVFAEIHEKAFDFDRRPWSRGATILRARRR
jgi:hypothetical protein